MDVVTNIHQLLNRCEFITRGEDAELFAAKLEKKLRRGEVSFAELCEQLHIGPKPFGSEEPNGYIGLLKKLSPHTYDVDRAIILGKMKELNEKGLLGDSSEEPFIDLNDESDIPALERLTKEMNAQEEARKQNAAQEIAEEGATGQEITPSIIPV